MATESTARTLGRNALCSCGSRKKFKRCCEGKRTIVRSGWAWKVGGLVAAAALVIVPIAVINANAGKSDGASGPAAASASIQTPIAWQYDPATDRHWDPQHGHWHDGPPPPRPIDFFANTNPPAAAGAGTAVSGATPAAWEYDPQTNRHWHPQHGHWHDGQPPPESQRPPP
ncbi:MAG: SEC-C domain-containing protein [Planctomycetes bacterium]|nr:SEC-C domain-containing protein [Planctomycetota bacterium]